MSDQPQDRRQNDSVRNAIHAKLAHIETVVGRIDKALFGNGQEGFIKETRDDFTLLDKRVSKHGIYWKIAIKVLAGLVASGGGIAAIARYMQ